MDSSASSSSSDITTSARGSDRDLANGHSKKPIAILEACESRDLAALRALAESPGGFTSDDLRQQAWPVLLGFSPAELTRQGSPSVSWKELPRHRDEDQVRLDVDRAFVYYPQHQTDSELARQKEELSALILETLRRYPFLCYFQGYHDICQVILLVLPPPLRIPAVARLSALRIRDFMLPSLAPAICQLRLIPDILRASDPDLWRHLGTTEPFFALSGTLTMYAHDITTLGEISRLFDVLLAREPVFSVYMFAKIIINRRDELFDTPSDEPEMLHSILSKLPQPLDLEDLISGTATLFDAHPPKALPSWRRLSAASVLKTARVPETYASQTMEDGETFFDRQVRDLQWMRKKTKIIRALRKYRRPAGAMGFAILVGVVAVVLRKYPSSFGYVSASLARGFG